MPDRKPISKRVRFEVFKRDKFVCQYCGAHPPKAILHVDHIVAVANGGQNGIDNLVTACDHCNLGKGARPLTLVPRSIADKSTEVAEREAQLRGYNAILQERRERIEEEAWRIAAELQCVERLESYSRSNLQSITMFLERLPFEEVLDAARITVGQRSRGGNKFKYFCGVCWRKIKDGR